jgi:spore coat protein A
MFMAISFCSSRPAPADVVNLQASKDNTIYSESSDLSNGSGAYFFAGRTNVGPVRRGLVAFNVSSIPSGATVNSVTLTLYMSRTQAGAENVGVHRVTSDWGEGASNAPGQEGDGDGAETGDATWMHTFYNTSLWTSAGGDFVGTASATTSVAGTGVYYAWTSAGMVTDVQSWVNTPATNFGWILIGNETTTQTAKRFNSRQNNTANQRPVLTVDFTPPATTGACCFTDGSCLILSQTDCTNQSGTYQGNGTSCTPNPCPQPTGACCFSDGTCQVLEADDCASQNGVFQGNMTSCTPNPCLGACCFNDGTCQELNIDDCAAMSDTYQGFGTACPADPTDLCPVVLTPFIDPLPIPPLATPTVGMPGGAATYDMNIVQVQQQLHTELSPTTVWTYEGMYPGPTILATRDLPVTVNWINDLPPGAHYLPVDLCPHGAANEPKVVTHLHGGHVPAAVDGYPEDTFLPGNMVTYEYPNNQVPSLIWYHDHALGITRLNVYMGMAGGYLITDAFEQGLDLPSGEYDVPLIIQDRSFKSDGTWKYPAAWQDHFFGDKMLVNGMVWPFLNVEQGKYRFRLLNGCNSRALTLAMSNGAPFTLIGMDGGLLPAPIVLTELTLGGAERADVIVDFAAYAPGTEIILQNSAPAPYPGTPGVGVVPNVMKFIVQNDTGFTDAVPMSLRPFEALLEADAVQTRDFELQKSSEPCTGSYWLINGLHWNHITEYPVLGTTEIWRFINRSGVMHPMHMHLVFFQVLDKQQFEVIDDVVTPIGMPVPPDATESGWKDTVRVGPSEIVRVIVRFDDYVGKYPYHCHILEHEDHEMMRQFQTVCCKGDTNQDVKLTAGDIQYFVDTMVGGGIVGTAEFCATDMDDNGVLDLVVDGDLFVDTLIAGQACLP